MWCEQNKIKIIVSKKTTIMNYRNNTSFLMKYKPEDFFTLNEIDLSGSQGHVISDAEINEINKYSNRLLYLYMLNVSHYMTWMIRQDILNLLL